MLASWHFLDVLLPRGSAIWSAPGGNSQLVETRRVPEFPMSFQWTKGFCGTSSLLWANEHAAPRLHWLTFLRWVHGFTAPPASFETLKDLTLPKQVADRRHKSVSVAKLDLRSSGNRSLSCLWSQQVFEPQSKNAGERVICQKRKDITRWFHIISKAVTSARSFRYAPDVPRANQFRE